MMFLHFQRQRQNKEKQPTQPQVVQKHDSKDSSLDLCSRLATNRTVFICLSIGGFLFFLHGMVFFAVGLKDNSTELLVIGPVFIVVGVLILLLCADILIFMKKLLVVRNNEEINPKKKAKCEK